MPNSVVTRRPFRKRGQAQAPFFFSVPPPPMELSLAYMDDFGRVRASVSNIPGATSYITIQWSLDLTTWTTVRGGSELTVDNGETEVDDYEFPAGVEVTYRATAYNASDNSIATDTASITVDIETVWLKSIEFPFLNRPVTVTNWSPIERQFRGGIFPVVGRSFPVAVTDLRSSRSYTLEAAVQTRDVARDVDYLLTSGGPIFVHVPGDCPIPQMYAIVDSSSSERRAATRSNRRVFTLPLTEIARPKLTIVSDTATWQATFDTYGSWEALITAYPTWDALLEVVSDDTEVTV